MLDVLTETENYVGIVIMLVIGLALAVPLIKIQKREKPLTWTEAVLLGTLLGTISLILIADVPSRMLYWFDANYTGLAEAVPVLSPLLLGQISLGQTIDKYIVVRDIVVNTVQGVIFVIFIALVYLWGERHRKQGRFKS